MFNSGQRVSQLLWLKYTGGAVRNKPIFRWLAAWVLLLWKIGCGQRGHAAIRKCKKVNIMDSKRLHRDVRDRIEKLDLVAELALHGLRATALSPEDCADFFEGLSAFLPTTKSEAARYAATCFRESARAQRDFVERLNSAKGGASSR